MDNFCDSCGKHFSNPWNLTRHVKVHDENWVLKCTHCCYKTKRSDHLKDHKELYHPSNDNVEPTQLSEASDSIIMPQKTVEFDKTVDFDLKLQLPNNFVYAGSTQSVSSFHFIFHNTLFLFREKLHC